MRGHRYFSFFRKEGSLAPLDGLRALAVILVLLRHAVVPFWDAQSPLLPVGRFDAAVFLINGWVGVDLFFVLSGFLITHHIRTRYLDTAAQFRWREYLARRFLRIVPAYYAVLFATVLGLFPFYVMPASPALSSESLLSHVFFLQDYTGSDILVTFWSLGVEEKFYLLAPFLLLFVLRARTPAAVFFPLSVLFLLPAALRYAAYGWMGGVESYHEYFISLRSPFHFSFDGLAAGVCAALLHHRGIPQGKFSDGMFLAGGALIVVLLGSGELLSDLSRLRVALLPTLLSAGFGAMVLAAAGGGGPVRLLSAQPLFWVAILSYSLYLVHLPLMPLCRYWGGYLFAAEETMRTERFLVFLPVFAAVSLVAALALHYGVEKPFLLWRDKEKDKFRPFP